MIDRWFLELRGHQLEIVVFCVIWEFLEYLRRAELRTKSHPTVGASAWPPVGKEPEIPPAESALRIAPVCKEPPAARARGPRDQDKTRRGEPGIGVQYCNPE